MTTPIFVRTQYEAKDALVNVYNGSLEEVKTRIEDLFHMFGYKLNTATPDFLQVEKGSRVLRLLLGAFVKYFKFDVNFVEKEDGVHVTISRKTTGMSGGVIGMNQVKNEFVRIKDAASNL